MSLRRRRRNHDENHDPVTPIVRRKAAPGITSTPPSPPPAPVSSQPESAFRAEDWPSADGDEFQDVVARDYRQVYRLVRMAGWDDQSARLWAAYTAGIPLADMGKPWTLHEIGHLLELRHRHQRGELDG